MKSQGCWLATALLAASLGVHNSVTAKDFDREYVGVSFSPYTKQWEGESTPPRNSYNLNDIKIMLELISTKFTHIATYSMGTTTGSLGKPFDQGDANGLIPRAASQLNAKAGKTLISIAQGIHQNQDPEIFKQEVESAFAAAREANAKHHGTVWALIFTNQYITDDERGGEVLKLIHQNKERASAAGLKVGVRTNTCDQIKKGGPAKETLTQIARDSDFIMCNFFPSPESVKKGVQAAIDNVSEQFEDIHDYLHDLNPKLQFILGDTGWPSAGRSKNAAAKYNNVENLVAYWMGINELASREQDRTYLFEAFDEPWKSNIHITDPDLPGGRFGGEGHYGWWKSLDSYNTNPNKYVEKVTLYSAKNGSVSARLWQGLSFTTVIASVLVSFGILL